jgi:ActR/RegA family two-component response regulator
MPLVAILVEGSQTIRENLIPALVELADVRVQAVAETEDQAKQCLADMGDAWQLMVVDLFLKEGSGLGVVRACRMRAPHLRVSC